MRHAVHGHHQVMHHQLVVHRDADVHLVDRLIGSPRALTGNVKRVRFGVTQMAFYVPQAIGTAKALVTHLAGVCQGAGLGNR